MKRKKKKLQFIIPIGICLTIGVYLICTEFLSGNKQMPIKAISPRNTIKTAVPKQKKFMELCHFFGKVKAIKKSDIIAHETGKIISINVTKGMSVKKGQLLFTIGGALINYKLNHIKNKITLLKKQISLAKQNLENDRNALKIKGEIKSLKQRISLAATAVKLNKKAFAEKLIRKTDLIKAKDTLAALMAQFDKNQRQIKNICLSDENKILILENQLKSTKQMQRQMKTFICVRSDCNGIFTGYHLYKGKQVQKNDKLAEIISRQNLYIKASLFLQKKGTKLKGKKAFINTPDNMTGKLSEYNQPLGKSVVLGIITNVMPQRTASGADIIWIKINNSEFIFKPEQLVSGEILLSVHKKALAIPETAIVMDKHGNSCVFVKKTKKQLQSKPYFSIYHKQYVKTGIISNGWIEIPYGIKKSDQIVVQGAYEIFYYNFNKIYKVAD